LPARSVLVRSDLVAAARRVGYKLDVGWWPKLLPHQVDLLRRIGEGRDPVTSRESRLATTVYALRGRRLVTTPRSGGAWTAAITDAGRYYLEHGRYIESAPRPPSRRGSSPTAKPSRMEAQPALAGGRVEPRRVPTLDELIQQLLEHGAITVPDPSPEVRAAWRREIHAVKRQGLVPEGFHLLHHGRDSGDLVVEVVKGDHPGRKYRDGDRLPVAVPDGLDAALPVVHELQREPERLGVSPQSVARALRLVQALAAGAARRGHALLLSDTDAGLVVVIGGRGYLLLMGEEWDTVDHLPDAQELDRAGAYAWQRVQPQALTAPSGRLTIELTDGAHKWHGRPRRWADRRRWKLEDKLSDILSEVEARAAIDMQADLAAERAKAQRQGQWELAVDLARAQYVDAYYVVSLQDQVDAWNRAQAARAYVAAIEDVTASGCMSEDLSRWVDWIKRYADRIDPVGVDLRPPPPPPEPDPDDLRPYLGRWSPYGPDRSY
jgi:hypothetical protein